MRALAYKVGRSRRPGRDAPNYTLSARSVLPGPLEAQGFSPNEEASHDDSKLPRPARARGTRSPGEVPVVLPQTPPGIRAGAYVSGGALCADQHVAVVGPPSRAVRELLRCSRSGRLPFRSGFFLSHLLLQEDESARKAWISSTTRHDGLRLGRRTEGCLRLRFGAAHSLHSGRRRLGRRTEGGHHL